MALKPHGESSRVFRSEQILQLFRSIRSSRNKERHSVFINYTIINSNLLKGDWLEGTSDNIGIG